MGGIRWGAENHNKALAFAAWGRKVAQAGKHDVLNSPRHRRTLRTLDKLVVDIEPQEVVDRGLISDAVREVVATAKLTRRQRQTVTIKWLNGEEKTDVQVADEMAITNKAVGLHKKNAIRVFRSRYNASRLRPFYS